MYERAKQTKKVGRITSVWKEQAKWIIAHAPWIEKKMILEKERKEEDERIQATIKSIQTCHSPQPGARQRITEKRKELPSVPIERKPAIDNAMKC